MSICLPQTLQWALRQQNPSRPQTSALTALACTLNNVTVAVLVLSSSKISFGSATSINLLKQTAP